jgi:processive 1,2-diacylglycerol beta-glucosyltransferase
VATHFYPLAILSSARRPSPSAPRLMTRSLAVPLVGVVTDYAAHAVWAEPGLDCYCAPAGKAVSDLVRHGAPIGRIEATGIPVRAAFGGAPELRLPQGNEPLRVLVTSGGFGVGPVARVLKSFAGIPHVALTIVCGNNPELVLRARALGDRFALRAEVVGFERNMPARIAEAHVVVGKPGGLTVSECLAAGRPLVLVGGVPGQETLNQTWLVEQGAGVVAAPREVGRCIARLRMGSELAEMGRRARALGAPDAADRVVDAVIRSAERVRRPRSRSEYPVGTWIYPGEDANCRLSP